MKMENDQNSLPPFHDKPSLRRAMMAQRTSLTPFYRRSYDRRLAEVFCAQQFFQEAGSMLIYLAFRGEPETDAIIETAFQAGKLVAAPQARRAGKTMRALPLYNLLEVTVGEWGMREPRETAENPLAPELFDLIVVPGLAFTERGDRLGYGGGYYDRYLALIRPDALTVGIGYNFQIIDRFPTESFDRRVDRLVTPEGVIICAPD